MRGLLRRLILWAVGDVLIPPTPPAAPVAEKPPEPPAEEIAGVESLYTPEQRLIFAYWDGEKEVWADPMTLYDQYCDISEDLRIDIEVWNSPSKGSREAKRRAVEKVRKLYNIVPFSKEKGLTDMEAMTVHLAFMDFVGEVKKNAQPSQTSPEEPTRGSAPCSEGAPATESSSASDCGGEGSSSATPVPSPSELPLPTA